MAYIRTDDSDLYAANLRAMGFSINEVANRTGIPRGSLTRICQRAQGRLNLSKTDKVKMLLAWGIHTDEIARRVNCHPAFARAVKSRMARTS